MVWRFPWSDSIKKRACRYLLQRYLGQFLKEKLTLEQLSIDIYEGTGEIQDILLDVDALNELGAANNLPVQFVDGYIRQVRFNVPWSALLTASSYVEIGGLMLTVQATQMLDDAAMFDSMLDSMSTSTIDMAKECLSQTDPTPSGTGETLEGIEALANAIDSVLLRIKVRFLDTLIRVEHVGQEKCRGVGVEIKIASMDYMDEAGRELTSDPESAPHHPSAMSVKRLSLEGVSLHGVEFRAENRAVPGSMAASFSEDKEELEEGRPCSPAPAAEPILLAQFNGRTELRCEVKVNDTLPGPKLSIAITAGSFCALCGPRQLHDLVELLSGIVDPKRVDKSTARPDGGGRQTEKPMTLSDYQVIEDQLLRRNMAARDLLTTQALRSQGWSSNVLDDEEDEYLPLVRPDAALSASVTSTATSGDLDGSMTSSAACSVFSDATSANRSEMSYSKQQRARRRRDRQRDEEQGDDAIRLRVQLTTVCLILLHDDVLTTAPDTQLLTQASSKQMQRLVESALARLSSLSLGGAGGFGSVHSARPALLEACPASHLSLVASPVKFECSERPSGGSRSVLSLALTAGTAELLECLVERRTSVSTPTATYTELLTFEPGEPPPSGPDPSAAGVGTEAAITLTLRHSQSLVSRRGAAATAVTVRLRLAACQAEVDISLADRLSALMTPATSADPVRSATSPSNADPADLTKQQCFNEAMNDASGGGDSKVDVQVTAPLIDVRLRIPVPDLRPLSDMARPPWWRRHLRPDSFHLRLRDVTMATALRPRDDALRMELQCRTVAGAYSETETSEPVHFFNVSAGAGGETLPRAGGAAGAVGLDWPRAVLTLWPPRHAPLLEAEGRGSPPAPDSSSSSPFAGLSSSAGQPSPFGTRRVVYETDAHARGQPDLASEGEELVVPATREEVDRFIDHTAANCQIVLELSLPVLEAILPDKRFYELIYNRLATDLALWEPAAPGASGAETARTTDPFSLLADPFQMCKSGTQYDSDTDSSGEEGLYQSVYEQRHRQRRRQKQEEDLVRSRQSRMCVRLNVQQACVAVQTPCLTEEGVPVVGHHGEVQLTADTASLFVASGYGGLYGHGYICVQAHRASLYHKGQMPTRSSPVVPTRDSLPPCLDRLVAPYDPDGCRRSQDMLSVAVKYQLDETNNIKTFTVAVGVDGCALRHRMLPPRQLFVSQLLDMFDVVDLPVAGYDMPATVTELHLQVTSSALDYRPLHLPYQYLITVDSFMLSSHLVTATATSVLRFILEEAALHVADRSGAALVSSRDYVCVVDAGLLELSIRTSETPDSGQPHLDWRISNNTIHVRTCADSLRALIQLVAYLANDGDLGGEPAQTQQQQQPAAKVRHSGEEEEALADLMEDAMQEASPPRPVATATNQGPVEVFFFPNEPHVAPQPPAQLATEAEPSNTVMATMAEALADIDDDFEEADESFCVLDDDPGSGIRSRSGEPQVRVLTAEPVRVIDGFLAAPLSRADVLRPPEHFSVPRRRYTLQQMSLAWSMYGGHDLPSSGAQPSARKVRIESPVATPPGSPRVRLGHASPGSPLEVTFSKHGASKVRFGALTPPDPAVPQQSPAVAARQRGGPGRQTDKRMELHLTKVRGQWEQYPEHTEEAGRLVLVVNDVEVLDRIASSDINKFLYQYSSEACPRQAHSNMILLKALSRRPDPAVPTEETDVRVSLCPIRLNVDQDALFFLRDFFRDVTGDQGGGGMGPAAPVSDAPVLSITQQDAPPTASADGGDDAADDDEEDDVGDDAGSPGSSQPADANLTFFRTFTFSPEVLIRIDYQGKRVDIGQFGPVIGLIIGLGQLNCSEIRLKRINHKSGLLGLDRLMHHALNEWLTDIRRNQLPSLIGGIGPLHSFLQLFQGIRDLLWLPIEQYQKDGRIVKGLQRGANSFSTSTAMAFLELTNRLVGYIQSASEFAYDMVSSGPPVRQNRRQKRPRRRTSTLPQDIREGVANAYELVKEGLGETAQTLARVAAEEHDQKGVSGAVGGVLRQIPPTMVKPILLASEATSNVLGGMRNQLAPDARQEAIDKWKTSE